MRIDVDKARAWQRRSTPLQRKTPMRHRAVKAELDGFARSLKQKRSRNEWSAKVKRQAAQRSGGTCEIDDCHATADHLHHRKKRRHGDHRIENALHLCAVHHDIVHSLEAESQRLGFIVHSTDDPAAVVVQLNPRRRVLLAGDGTYQEAA